MFNSVIHTDFPFNNQTGIGNTNFSRVSSDNLYNTVFDYGNTDTTTLSSVNSDKYTPWLFDNNNFDTYNTDFYDFSGNFDIVNGENITKKYPEVEQYSKSNTNLKPDKEMQKEFPVDENGELTIEVQEKFANTYSTLEEFDKDMKSGKFSYLNAIDLDSVRRHIRDNEDIKKFPIEIDKSKNTPDLVGTWNSETIKKIAEEYDNVEQLQKDLKNYRFSYILPESINALITAIMNKSV